MKEKIINGIKVRITEEEMLVVFSGGLGIPYDIKERGDYEVGELILAHAHCSRETSNKICSWALKELNKNGGN